MLHLIARSVPRSVPSTGRREGDDLDRARGAFMLPLLIVLTLIAAVVACHG